MEQITSGHIHPLSPGNYNRLSDCPFLILYVTYSRFHSPRLGPILCIIYWLFYQQPPPRNVTSRRDAQTAIPRAFILAIVKRNKKKNTWIKNRKDDAASFYESRFAFYQTRNAPTRRKKFLHTHTYLYSINIDTLDPNFMVHTYNSRIFAIRRETRKFVLSFFFLTSNRQLISYQTISLRYNCL